MKDVFRKILVVILLFEFLIVFFFLNRDAPADFLGSFYGSLTPFVFIIIISFFYLNYQRQLFQKNVLRLWSFQLLKLSQLVELNHDKILSLKSADKFFDLDFFDFDVRFEDLEKISDKKVSDNLFLLLSDLNAYNQNLLYFKNDYADLLRGLNDEDFSFKQKLSLSDEYEDFQDRIVNLEKEGVEISIKLQDLYVFLNAI